MEYAPGVFHLRGLDAELEGGERAAVLDQLLRREVADAARAHGAARAAGVVAQQLVLLLRRALDYLHALERDAERIRHDHRERGLVPVPLRLGLRVDGDAARSASSTISTSSFSACPAPVFSITVAMPMPRSLPCFSVRARRFG